MARSDPQMNFRIPLHLKEQLEIAAKQNGRSMTSEIVAILNDSINGVDCTVVPDIHDKLDLILERLDTKPHGS